MQQILEALEEAENERGWDRPPVLGAILTTDTGGAIAKLFGDLPQMHLPALIGQAGQQLLEDPDYTRKLLANLPGFFGVVGMTEAWAPPPDATVEDVEAFRVTGRGIADMPESTEARVLCAATLDGRVWMASRRRGQDPSGGELEPSQFAHAGELCLAVRTLLATLAMHMDEIGIDYLQSIIDDEQLHAIVRTEFLEQFYGAIRPNSSNEA